MTRTSALLAIVLLGCGAGQTVLSGQASVIMQTQPERYSFYEANHNRCLDSSEGLDAYLGCMAPARGAARAVDSYASSLQAAQDAYTAGGEGSFEASLPCVVSAAKRALEALVDANVPVPDSIRDVASLVPERLCHE